MAVDNREQAVQEVERRLWLVTVANGFDLTIASVKRNPDSVNTRFPCANIWELDDEVETRLIGGGFEGGPAYIRKLEILIEFFKEVEGGGVDENMEGAASKEAKLFAQTIRYALFHNDYGTYDMNLGGKCDLFEEVSASRVVRPNFGNNVTGMGLTFQLTYMDNRRFDISTSVTTTTTTTTSTSTTSTTTSSSTSTTMSTTTTTTTV